MTRKITISEVENGFIVTQIWPLDHGADREETSVFKVPMDVVAEVYSLFVAGEYEEPKTLMQVPERLQYKVREFINNNPE